MHDADCLNDQLDGPNMGAIFSEESAHRNLASGKSVRYICVTDHMWKVLKIIKALFS